MKGPRTQEIMRSFRTFSKQPSILGKKESSLIRVVKHIYVTAATETKKGSKQSCNNLRYFVKQNLYGVNNIFGTD